MSGDEVIGGGPGPIQKAVPEVPEGVPYFRVQGGGSGTATSRDALTVNADGSVTITPGCSGAICVSTGSADHAVYYISQRRPDGDVVVFEVDRATHNEIMQVAVPQAGNRGAPVQIVDPTTSGGAISLQLDQFYSDLMAKASSKGRVLTQQEFRMNLAQIPSELREGILKREECIGFFVHSSNYYWIVDWEVHFNLDQAKNIEALCEKPQYLRFLPKGLSIDQWRQQQINEFREGIPRLEYEFFDQYRDGQSAKVVSTELLHQEFFYDDFGEYADMSRLIEQYLSFGTSIPEESRALTAKLSSKLPKFYVNYDRKLFMHMVRGRSYEAVVLDGWWGAEGDFEHMIPSSHRYWVRNTREDFWALSNFSNF